VDEVTAALHAEPCPGCGCEPEVEVYWRRISDKVRIGYTCRCGARVIDGVVCGYNIG
jgi:hypothetical protein